MASSLDGIVSNIQTKRESGVRIDYITIALSRTSINEPPRDITVKIPHDENPFLFGDYIRITSEKPLSLLRVTPEGKTLEHYHSDHDVA